MLGHWTTVCGQSRRSKARGASGLSFFTGPDTGKMGFSHYGTEEASSSQASRKKRKICTLPFSPLGRLRSTVALEKSTSMFFFVFLSSSVCLNRMVNFQRVEKNMTRVIFFCRCSWQIILTSYKKPQVWLPTSSYRPHGLLSKLWALMLFDDVDWPSGPSNKAPGSLVLKDSSVAHFKQPSLTEELSDTLPPQIHSWRFFSHAAVSVNIVKRGLLNGIGAEHYRFESETKPGDRSVTMTGLWNALIELQPPCQRWERRDL